MIDATSQAVLQNLLRRESRSLLQYARESFPWITSEEQKTLACLLQIIREEQEGVAAVARFLSRNHLVPLPVGPYPMTFTNSNYVSLAHLLPLLVEYQRRRLRELEIDLGQVQDGGSRQQVESFLALKRRHQQSLGELEKSLNRLQTQAV